MNMPSKLIDMDQLETPPSISDRCKPLLAAHSAVGGAHGEEAARILGGFCSPPR